MPKKYADLTEEQKESRRKYYKEYHKRPDRIGKTRAKAVRDQAARRKKIKAIIFAYKRRPCVDCGTRLPAEVMELDHVRGVKTVELSKATRGGGYLSWDELDQELEKCDVRCPNCHRIRHHKLGHYGPPTGEEEC